jgi:hypothetical protein
LQSETPDLMTGIVAAQRADVFVGMHGANIANGWLMRPGSSVLEVTMYDFDKQNAHINLARRNMFVSVAAHLCKCRVPSAHAVHHLYLQHAVCLGLQDNDTEVQFWKVLLCDPKSWTPGVVEKQALEKGKPFSDVFPKFRNSYLR